MRRVKGCMYLAIIITRIDIRSSGFVITRLVTVSPRITEKRNKNKFEECGNDYMLLHTQAIF